jgi:DNA-binding NtrC family response regulator
MTRILVIDDQKDVRAMIGIVLRVHHFEVVEADSAAEGLKMFDGSAFDVAIVDIFLEEDASGFEVVARMREKIPDMPVVVMSGTTPSDAAPHSAEPSDVAFLRKPFRPNELIRAIEIAQLSRRPAGGASVTTGAG